MLESDLEVWSAGFISGILEIPQLWYGDLERFLDTSQPGCPDFGGGACDLFEEFYSVNIVFDSSPSVGENFRSLDHLWYYMQVAKRSKKIVDGTEFSICTDLFKTCLCQPQVVA